MKYHTNITFYVRVIATTATTTTTTTTTTTSNHNDYTDNNDNDANNDNNNNSINTNHITNDIYCSQDLASRGLVRLCQVSALPEE